MQAAFLKLSSWLILHNFPVSIQDKYDYMYMYVFYIYIMCDE